MSKEIPSIGALRKRSEVSDDEIRAAVAAYERDPEAGPFRFKSGHTIDVAKAIEMHPKAKEHLADPANNDKPAFRRNMVMTAVIEGFPVAP